MPTGRFEVGCRVFFRAPYGGCCFGLVYSITSEGEIGGVYLMFAHGLVSPGLFIAVTCVRGHYYCEWAGCMIYLVMVAMAFLGVRMSCLEDKCLFGQVIALRFTIDSYIVAQPKKVATVTKSATAS